jgi:hypothetical protein
MDSKLKRKNFIIPIFYVAVGIILGAGAMFFSAPQKVKLEKEYPEVAKLSDTNSLTCEVVAENYIGALNNCNEKNVKISSELAKPERQDEGMRLKDEHGNDVITDASEVKIRQILWRRDGETIFLKTDRLIQALEDKEIESKYTISHESEKFLIATGLTESTLATHSATIFLDKEQGLLMQTTNSSGLFCSTNLSTRSSLYRCY